LGLALFRGAPITLTALVALFLASSLVLFIFLDGLLVDCFIPSSHLLWRVRQQMEHLAVVGYLELAKVHLAARHSPPFVAPAGLLKICFVRLVIFQIPFLFMMFYYHSTR